MGAEETVKIYIRLLEEGVEVACPTQAISLGDNLYKVLPTPIYDPTDEKWEFLPGTIVYCEMSDSYETPLLLAIRKIEYS